LAIDRGERSGFEVTEGQREAIEEAMRIIIEEDRDRGIDPLARFRCERCRRPEHLLGSVLYGDIRLCNLCATTFEVARISGRVRTCAQYVGGRRIRTMS
jgi:hypothetical protein